MIPACGPPGLRAAENGPRSRYAPSQYSSTALVPTQHVGPQEAEHPSAPIPAYALLTAFAFGCKRISSLSRKVYRFIDTATQKHSVTQRAAEFSGMPGKAAGWFRENNPHQTPIFSAICSHHLGCNCLDHLEEIRQADAGRNQRHGTELLLLLC